MAVYEIGEFIRDLRLERGYSQEELCFGICSTGNLSKIENGTRMPSRKTIEALMQRLGCEDVFLQFSSREEMRQVNICKQIIQRLADREFEGLEELVAEFEATISEDDVLNSQYCRFTKVMINQQKGMKAECVIQELEKVLEMTKPGYKKYGLMPKGLLTYNEIVIIINIANSYAGKDDDKAKEILFTLKDYMETHVLDGEERAKKYILIVFNLSNLLFDSEQFKEVVEMCEQGLMLCKKYNRLRLFPKFLVNKGLALLELGEREQAQIELKKGCCILDALNDDVSEGHRLKSYLEKEKGMKI